jgi:ABC-type siderophore export system fused ATPase/permease subunit
VRENKKESNPRSDLSKKTDSKGRATRGLGHETTDEIQFPLNGKNGDFKYRDNDGSMNHPAFRVQGMDIHIKKGSLVMIIGKNGSGKSS